MPTAREVLNELRWRKDRQMGRVKVHYVHRGAPGDEMVLRGDDITGLEQLFFHTAEATIPYHRIFLITYEGTRVFSRERARHPRDEAPVDGGPCEGPGEENDI